MSLNVAYAYACVPAFNIYIYIYVYIYIRRGATSCIFYKIRDGLTLFPAQVTKIRIIRYIFSGDFKALESDHNPCRPEPSICFLILFSYTVSLFCFLILFLLFLSLKAGNYTKKRCYELDLSIFYKIPGGLTLPPAQVTTKVTSTINSLATNLVFFNSCKDIKLTKGVVSQSPPGQSDVMIKATLVFKASDSVPDSDVSSRLSSCIQTALGFKNILDNNLPALNINGRKYSAHNKSTISPKRSCCGGVTPPPCCTAGSVGVSSAYCGKWLIYYCLSPSAPNC